MNRQPNHTNTNNSSRTTIEIVHSANSSHMFQSTIRKLAEITELPIKIICGDKDKYLIRQQINEIQTNAKVFIDGDESNPSPSIIVTFHS